MLSHRSNLVIFCLGWLILAVPHATVASDQASLDPFLVMAEAGINYLNDPSACPGVLSAAALFDNLEMFTVVDIRAENAYLAGHIPGAFHSSLGAILDDLDATIPSGKPYVIAGYTGQVAGQAKMAMELSGYNDVYSLLYGMSAWNTALDYWTNNCGDALTNPETTNQNDNLVDHVFPNLGGDPSTIVAERVAANLAAGYKGVNYVDIMDNLEDYFVINYFGAADYLGEGTAGVPGHIPGAFQFTPYASMGVEQMLSKIPIDQPVVVYGWTGQHSSSVVAYLNMLGYAAYSLKYGTNALFHSELLSHAWGPYAMHDFPLEIGLSAVPDAGYPVVTHLGNHPNPFNPSTTIDFALDRPGNVTLQIYDIGGRVVRTLFAGRQYDEGRHQTFWDGMDNSGRVAASGTYFYRLEAGEYSETKRMALIK